MASSDEPLRLGGMALRNGLLVHGPTAWAAAVRTTDGAIEVAGGRKGRDRDKPSLAGRIPVARGLLRLADAFAVLPRVRRALPEARLAFESPAVVVLTASAAALTTAARRTRLSPATIESLAAVLALVPALGTLRSGALASYHGAEHKVIGAYEHGGEDVDVAKEHERCGSHLVAPLIVTSLLGNVLAGRASASRRGPARAAASLASSGIAVEVFGWMVRHRGNPLARVLALPGTAMQRVIGTREPSGEELAVARAALDRLLELEGAP